MLAIVQAPNPVLSEVAKPVIKVDSSIKKLLSEMKKTLEHAKDPEGVGLAAPQVGKSLRIFIMKPTPSAKITAYINPEIIERSEVVPDTPKKKKGGVKLEGCLSLKDIWGVVRRSPKIIMRYTNEQGKMYTKSFRGFSATIIQHEIDHLDGILFPRRVLEQNNKLYKSLIDSKGETFFEKIDI